MFSGFFNFNRSERRGIIVLLFLLFFFLLLPRLYAFFFPPQPAIDYQKIASLVASWDSLSPSSDSVALFVFNPNTATRVELMQLGLSEKVANTVLNYRQKVGNFSKKEDFKRVWGITEEDYNRLEPYINLSQEQENSKKNANERAVQLFDFDPNFVTKAELLQLGLSEKTANNLINYREKGAKFFKKEDFKKVWGVTADDYQRLEPYIITQPFANNDTPKSYNQAQVTVDINTATAEELKQLKGIGEKTADRIVRFRDALGGFVSIEQVGETWGLPKDVFHNLKPQFVKSDVEIRKINLNTASVDDLKAHPYLKWKEANIIVQYREQHGDFKNVAELKNIKIIDGVLLDKLIPYLSVQSSEK